VANRYEWKPAITDALAAGTVVICDRYLASSVAYGEAHGLDAGWLRDVQRHLPQPDLTMLLDIPPDASVRRKTTDRDKYERDLALLARVRESYLRQARDGWIRLDADRPRADVSDDVFAAVTARLA
jgi:dTMP kinase